MGFWSFRPWGKEKGKLFPFIFEPKFSSRGASATSTFFKLMRLIILFKGDMSIATANYLYRHGFEGGSRSTRIQTRKSSTNEIIDFDELEKLKKYTWNKNHKKHTKNLQHTFKKIFAHLLETKIYFVTWVPRCEPSVVVFKRDLNVSRRHFKIYIFQSVRDRNGYFWF